MTQPTRKKWIAVRGAVVFVAAAAVTCCSDGIPSVHEVEYSHVLEAPQNPTAHRSGVSTANLSWISGGGTTKGYLVNIEPGKMSSVACESGTDVSTALSYSFNSLISGDYTLGVCSYDAKHSVSKSVTAFIHFPENPPPAPSGISLYWSSSTQLSIQWTAGGGSTSGYYFAFQKGSTQPDCMTGSQVGSVTTVVEPGLLYGAAYSASVCAYDSNAVTSYQIGATQLAIPNSPPPAAPVGLNLTADSASQLTALWTPGNYSTTAGFYVAFAKGNNAAPCTSGAKIGPMPWGYVKPTGLLPSTTYTVSVCAFNSYGAISQQVSTSGATLSSPFPPPTGITVSAVTGSSFTATWSPGDGQTTGYYVGFATGSFPALCTDGINNGNQTSFTHQGLDSDTLYTISVCAYRADGVRSSQVSIGQTTQVDLTPPPAPSNIVMSAVQKGFLAATWTSGGGTTKGFYFNPNPGTTAAPCDKGYKYGLETTEAQGGLVSNQPYTFSVCAYNGSGILSSQINATQNAP